MDLDLAKGDRSFLTRSRKKWILLSALLGASAYGAYRAYHTPSVARKRKRLARLIGALFSVLEVVADSAETVGVVSRDLKEFLSSDSDEIPNSLKQISKIARSDQFCRSVTSVSQALTVGVLRGYRSESGSEPSASVADQVMDRLLSNAGSGFVSVVAGSFARNLVLGFYDNDGQAAGDSTNSTGWVDVICNDKIKDVMANSIQVFVSTAVAAYLDKTLGVNTYDELFAGLTNPKHEGRVRDMLVFVCNGAVETLVKTSHQVLTKNDPTSDSCNPMNGSFGRDGDSADLTKKWVLKEMQSNGWIDSISSTLAVPSNRRFVMDMTGRVTFETVRSIVSFFLCKASDGLRSGANVARDQVRDRGLEVVRYFSAKSSVIMTICLALYLHVMSSTRPMLAA